MAMHRTLSRAANSIRDGLGDYLGINEKYTQQNRSYYIEQPQDKEPYWMKEKFWGEEGGAELQPTAPPMDGVTVIPNAGYRDDEPPPPYSDVPPNYNGGQQVYVPQFVAANVGPVDRHSVSIEKKPPQSPVRGRGRGRGRGGRGRGGAGRGKGGAAVGGREQKVAPPPQYRPFFIITITLIDCVLIVWEIILNGGFEPWSVNPWFGPSTTILVECGAKYAPLILDGEWWRFISPIFLHVGLGHLLMNMLMQVRVGISLERAYGAHRIIPIYMICGIMGNLVSSLMLPTEIQVGASGALYGFIGVLFADLIQNWGLIENPMKNLFSLILTTLVSLCTGLVLPGVDNFAHIGGGLMGVITGFIFLPTLNPAKKGKKGRIVTVGICIPLMVAIFTILFILFYRQIDSTEWCYGCQYITCIKQLSWCNQGT